MKRPVIEYRTVSVQPIDPVEEPEVQQQAVITWEKISNASVISDGDSLSIVYTADSRKELVRFLAGLGEVLSQ